MFSDVFLAMTGSEMQQLQPKKAAYMACHFSPYGQGLSNLPVQLPENSLLLLDDSTPITVHNPKLVADQLRTLVDTVAPKALLLDFQREVSDEARGMLEAILQNVTCPVAVSERYCAGLDCSVLLPPLPANKPLAPYLAPFLKSGVYLEIAPEALEITVTNTESKAIPIPLSQRKLPLEHRRLICHYGVEVMSDRAVFTLQRSKEDLAALTRQAYSLGVLGVVGLHQELSKLCTD